MAKQLSWKDQMYQQIANSQVQQVIKEQRDQDYKMAQDLISQYQPTEDDFAIAQNLISQYQPQTQQPVKQATVSEVKAKSAPVEQEKIPSIADFFKPMTASGKDVNKESANAINREAYARQQQKENELASKATKRSKEEIAKNIVENKTVDKFVPQANVQDQNSVNDYRKALFEKKDTEKTEKYNEAEAEKSLSEKKEIGNSINQVDLSQYDLPSNGFDDGFSDSDKAKIWTQPGYKLTKEEAKEAKRIAREGIQRLEKPTGEQTSPAYFGRSRKSMTPEEQAQYDMYKDLELKSNEIASMGVGAADKAVSMAGGLLDIYALMHPLDFNAKRAAKYYGELQNKYDEQAENARDLAKNAAPLVENVPLINEITPYGVGQTATQIGAYMLTNDAFDEMGAAVGGKLGGFVGNQIGQNAQDIPLDTIPLIKELAKDGELSAEDWKEVSANIRNNAIGNLIMGGIGEIPGLVRGIGDSKAAKNAAKQVEEAAQNVEDASKQIPKLPEENYTTDIYKDTEPFSITKDPYYLTQEEFEAGQKRLQDYLNEPSANNKELAENYINQNSSGPDIDNAFNDIQSFIDGFSGEKELHKELTNSLDEVKNAIRNGGDIEGARAKLDNALNSAAEIVQQDNDSLLGDITSEAFQKVKSATDGSVIRLNKSVLKDALGDDAIFSDLNNMVYTGKGSIKFREGSGAPIDSIYNELRVLSDYELPEAHAEADQVAAIAKYISDVKAKNITPDNSAINEVKRLGNSLDEAIGSYNPNKVMAEEISRPKSEVTTSEPIEPGRYQIPDTPENAPIEPAKAPDVTPPDNGDYVSQFRTHNEQNFNMTDEELNNKYFNTQNENFNFLKGNRAVDLENATRNLETNYDSTVNKLLQKPRDTQFTPQEVDEGFMAWNKELTGGRQTGDYSKAADIMYRMTQDAHDKGAGLQAYAAWKKNSPAGVVLDASEKARGFAEDKVGKKYVKELDSLTNKIDDICKSGASLDDKIKQIDTLMKEAKGKGYKNGLSGAEQMAEMLKTGDDISVSHIHDILYEANKVPNLSAKSQSEIAQIASEMYGRELTDLEKRQYINQINMILSREKHWSVKDKAVELTHILMLSGTRTHIKNFVANVGMLPQEALARKISAVGQNAYKHLADPDYKPTQAFHVSKNSKRLAEQLYEAKGGADAIAEGVADKYTNRLADRIGATYMFGTGKKNVAAKANDAAQNLIPGLKKAEDNAAELANKALKKMGSEGAYDAMDANASILENYRQFIYGSLSGLEDNPFVKKNFVDRLASYVEAQGIKSLDDIPEEAIDIARAEALKATFKDDNSITALVQSFKKIPGIGELMFPFTKTPANLLARSIDFSPIGFARSLYGAINKNSRFAKETVGETIDEISKGLGGSATMALGMWLYANGLITGKKSDDIDIANYMANQGWQQYSLSTKGIADFINSRLGTNLDLGDDYHDFSFLQPSTTNIIAAEEVWDELMDGKKITEKTPDDIFNRVKSVAGSYTDALLAQSTLQNVGELFGSQYSDDGVGGNLVQKALEFPTRFTSGAIGDAAKLSDNTKREYYSKNKPLETVKNAVVSKLPVLSETLPAKYDDFGNELKRNEEGGQNVVNTLLNPSTTTHRNDNPRYNFIDSLNEQSESGDYVPTKTLRKIKLDDETELSLDNKQYSEASRVAGETRAKLLDEAKKNQMFKNMAADQQVAVLDNLEKIAVSKGYKAIVDNPKITEETQKYIDMYNEGGVNSIINNSVAKNIVKEYGISSGSNAADDIATAIAKGNTAEAQRIATTEKKYIDACEKAGITEKSTGTRKAWDEGGMQGLKDYQKKQEIITKYDLEKDDTAKSVYDSYGEDGLKEYTQFKESGIKGKSALDLYHSAKEEGGKIPSIKDYAQTYSKIDNYGTGDKKGDGKINQDEFKAYLAANNFSEEKAAELAQLYGDWKTIPKLTKDGWQFKKQK